MNLINQYIWADNKRFYLKITYQTKNDLKIIYDKNFPVVISVIEDSKWSTIHRKKILVNFLNYNDAKSFQQNDIKKLIVTILDQEGTIKDHFCFSFK